MTIFSRASLPSVTRPLQNSLQQRIKISDKIKIKNAVNVISRSFTLIYINQTNEFFANKFRNMTSEPTANRNRLRIYSSKTKQLSNIS